MIQSRNIFTERDLEQAENKLFEDCGEPPPAGGGRGDPHAWGSPIRGPLEPLNINAGERRRLLSSIVGCKILHIHWR